MMTKCTFYVDGRLISGQRKNNGGDDQGGVSSSGLTDAEREQARIDHVARMDQITLVFSRTPDLDRLLPLDDALEMIDRGEINGAKTVVGLFAAERRVRS